MKSSNIEKYNTLYRENLDPNNYSISLLNEALRIGLIDQAAMERVQSQVMVILAELIRKYTKGESSSLKAETSQRLLLSIFYAIDADVSKFDDPYDALDSLISDDIKEVYKHGLELLESSLSASRQLYQDIEKTKLDVQIEAYQSTLNAIPAFFQEYDLLYNAQDSMANIDYPLLFDDMRIQGVFYIQQYLRKLLLENQFCQLFAAADINHLLANYGRVYRINYREALINVCEIVLSNAIFSVLSGNQGAQLRITEEQFAVLQQKFKDFDNDLAAPIIAAAIDQLLNDLQVDTLDIKVYLRQFKSVLSPRLINAIENDCLQNIIIIDREAAQHFDIIFDEGNSLDDEHFRQVADEIMDCSQAEDKTVIIRSSIHSLGDFIDILEAECLFGDEYHTLFNSLGDMELSILARIVFIEEIRCNLMDFSLTNPEDIAGDMEWQAEFCSYLQRLNPQRIELIEKHIKSSLQMNESWDFLG